MPDSYTNLLYHIIFSTKDRRPIITPEYEIRLYDYLGGTIRKLGGISLELNGTKDLFGALTQGSQTRLGLNSDRCFAAGLNVHL
jgi:hypothetical protein